MPRPALIFDFGNVIAFFDFEKATTKLGVQLGLSGRELYERLGPLGFAKELQLYERGQLSAGEFRERVARLISLPITHDEFAAAWSDIFTANASIIPLIEDLKRQGYRLVLGSNTNDLHAAQFRRQFAATLQHFDQLVLSFEVGHVKPARDFYLACARAAQTPPAQCIFIDDLAENVAGAQAAGLMGLLYRDTAELAASLKQLDVVVNRSAREGCSLATTSKEN